MTAKHMLAARNGELRFDDPEYCLNCNERLDDDDDEYCKDCIKMTED